MQECRFECGFQQPHPKPLSAMWRDRGRTAIETSFAKAVESYDVEDSPEEKDRLPATKPAPVRSRISIPECVAIKLSIMAFMLR